MTKRFKDIAARSPASATSAGVPWSEVPASVLHFVEWMDGRHGPAQDSLPTIEDVPIPPVLCSLPRLHPDRPRGSKPMIDVHGARSRLSHRRPGAWSISPYTGWRWAKWPDGEVGWLPNDVSLPASLRVGTRNDLQ
jgi:hypothetical protein